MYIGKTQQTLSRRQYKHKNSSKVGKSYFYNSIRKYGWDSFSWVVIDETTNDKLAELEIEYIAYYTMIKKHLYNLTTGGDGFTGKHSDQTKNKIRDTLTGRKNSQDLAYRKTKHRIKTYSLVSPDGVLINITNMEQFCRQHNYDSGFMSKVIHGKKKSAYGWTLPKQIGDNHV